MSTAGFELRINETSATTDWIHYPWVPAGNIINEWENLRFIGPQEEKPEKKKSKWLLKQMGRRGHQR